MSIQSKMGNDIVAKFGGLLRCMTCGNEQSLTGARAGRYLTNGWPRCCGYTMRWLTQTELDAAEQPIRSPEASK